MNRIAVLRHLDLICLKKSGSQSDSPMVPMTGVSVAVAKQGATISGSTGITINGTGDVTVPVFHTGSCVAGGTLTYFPIPPVTSAGYLLTIVSAVSNTAAPYIVVQGASPGQYPFTMPPGTRLIFNASGPVALIYPDPLGKGIPETYLTVDAYGIARGVGGRPGGYIKEYRFDVHYDAGGSEGRRIFPDLEGSWVMR